MRKGLSDRQEKQAQAYAGLFGQGEWLPAALGRVRDQHPSPSKFVAIAASN